MVLLSLREVMVIVLLVVVLFLIVPRLRKVEDKA